MWVENVADFEEVGTYNLSMYERNRVYMNLGRARLVEVSYLSAADVPSDSRAVAVGDLNEDGRPDMVVRNSGGGPLRVFLNRVQGGRSLLVTLRGLRSNPEGIGARLVLEVDGRRLYREHFPQNSLMAQNACETIFGVGEARGPFRLTVTWPSGAVQVLEGLEPGRIQVEELAE